MHDPIFDLLQVSEKELEEYGRSRFIEDFYLRGYLWCREDFYSILCMRNRRSFSLLSKEFASFKKLATVDVVMESLPDRLTFINNVKDLKTTRRMVLGPPQTIGLISGWVWQGADPGHVDIWIDGEHAGNFKANRFRIDLLKNGISTGAYGFRVRPPKKYLDGGFHDILVKCSDFPELEHKDRAKLPFHFDEEKAWVHPLNLESLDETNSAEEEFNLLRNYSLCDAKTDLLPTIGKFIDRNPTYIFKDFYLHENDKKVIRITPKFKDILDDRWGTMYDPNVCQKGDSCCKTFALSYNDSRAVHPKRTNHTADELLDCPIPIRHFASKTFTKSYGQKFGVESPETLAVISTIEEFDAYEFPNRYVLKPVFGSGVGLYLMHSGLNMFDGRQYSRDELRNKFLEFKAKSGRSTFIVEELLVQEGVEESRPIVPLDFKFHCFGGKARLVHVDDRNCVSRDSLHRAQSWLSRDWMEAPMTLRDKEQSNKPLVKPKLYDEMLRIADMIASNLGRYVRVDLYATNKGVRLGEVTTWTHQGRGFNVYGDRILSQAYRVFESDSEYS